MTHPDNHLDVDVRYWRQRCEEVEEDNHSLREQLQAHVSALHKAQMTIMDGELVDMNDEEEQ